MRGVDHGPGARLCLACQHSPLQILGRWILGNSCEVSGTYRRFAVRLAEGDKVRALPVLSLWVREATRWAGSVPPDLRRSLAGTQAHRFPFRRGKAGAPRCRCPCSCLCMRGRARRLRDTVRALNTGRGRHSSLRGLGLTQSTATLSRIPALTLYTRWRTGVPNIQAIVGPS